MWHCICRHKCLMLAHLPTSLLHVCCHLPQTVQATTTPLQMLTAEASLEVTRALLHADFGVTWELQQGQLVPPVANRANYIHWLEDLLRLSSPDEPAQACGESQPNSSLQR